MDELIQRKLGEKLQGGRNVESDPLGLSYWNDPNSHHVITHASKNLVEYIACYTNGICS